MHDWLRAAVAGTVLLTGACGIFDGEEERLPGERIPVREYRRVVTTPPAPPVPEVADPEQQDVQ